MKTVKFTNRNLLCIYNMNRVGSFLYQKQLAPKQLVCFFEYTLKRMKFRKNSYKIFKLPYKSIIYLKRCRKWIIVHPIFNHYSTFIVVRYLFFLVHSFFPLKNFVTFMHTFILEDFELVRCHCKVFVVFQKIVAFQIFSNTVCVCVRFSLV